MNDTMKDDYRKLSNDLQRKVSDLRAELALIKPSWDDAPEWATERITFILSKRNIEDTIVHSEYIRRPKDDR